jgi:hypothetical protein
MTLRDTIASCLVIALGAILALNFAFFWLYGGVFIYESNKVVLSIETAMSVAIFGFGIERLLCSANKKHKREASTISLSKAREDVSTEYIASLGDFQMVRKAAIPNGTMATLIPPKTITMLVDSDSRYTENCTFKMSNSTEDSGHVIVHTTDTDRDHIRHNEGLVSPGTQISR